MRAAEVRLAGTGAKERRDLELPIVKTGVSQGNVKRKQDHQLLYIAARERADETQQHVQEKIIFLPF